MITNSFVVLDKISVKKESNLWNQGIKTWNDFLQKPTIKGISTKQKELYDIQLEIAKDKLQKEDHEYFKKIIPSAEQWRLYNYFKENTAYLDIETSSYYGDITVIGIYDGYDTKTMVKDINLDSNTFFKELDKYKYLVTYNGGSFDIPIIEKYFNKKINLPHMDLKTVCNRVGLTGGLKEVEKQLNIKRAKELECMRGEHAVDAWKMFKVTGDQKYLEILIKYNEEDIINLKPIAEHSVNKLWSSIYSNSSSI